MLEARLLSLLEDNIDDLGILKLDFFLHLEQHFVLAKYVHNVVEELRIRKCDLVHSTRALNHLCQCVEALHYNRVVLVVDLDALNELDYQQNQIVGCLRVALEMEVFLQREIVAFAKELHELHRLAD